MRDIHCHLSGATSQIVLFELIRESGYKFPAKDFWDFERQIMLDKNNVHDLRSYLSILHTIDKAQSSPMAIERSVYNAFMSSYMAGCGYLELRWNVTKRSANGNIDLDSLIISARAGMEKAKMNFGIEGGLCLCLGRDVSVEANAAIFKKALQYNGKGVKAIDIAGPYYIPKSKEEMPNIDYKDFITSCNRQNSFDRFYQEAKDVGLLTTCHSGEEKHHAVYEEMEYVLDVLKPHRIGHFIQSYRYPDLLERLKEANIELEICISSNLATKAVSGFEEFRTIFETFNKYGIRYTLCTDATYLLKTTIANEHKLYKEIMGI